MFLVETSTTEIRLSITAAIWSPFVGFGFQENADITPCTDLVICVGCPPFGDTVHSCGIPWLSFIRQAIWDPSGELRSQCRTLEPWVRAVGRTGDPALCDGRKIFRDIGYKDFRNRIPIRADDVSLKSDGSALTRLVFLKIARTSNPRVAEGAVDLVTSWYRVRRSGGD